VDIFNVYNRQNAAGFDCDVTVNSEQVRSDTSLREMLPLVPTLGVRWLF
jgi:hypothetical protein